MCCFRLHFSDFIVLFFEKIKNLLQFTFEKNNLLCKKREKNNRRVGVDILFYLCRRPRQCHTNY